MTNKDITKIGDICHCATMSIQDLAKAYWVAAETAATEENHMVAWEYRRYINLIEAIGQYRFPDRWAEELEKETIEAE